MDETEITVTVLTAPAERLRAWYEHLEALQRELRGPLFGPDSNVREIALQYLVQDRGWQLDDTSDASIIECLLLQAFKLERRYTSLSVFVHGQPKQEHTN